MSSQPSPSTQNIDPLIHEAARLLMISALNTCKKANFNFVLAATGLTRGNFSTHMTRLIEAGYVAEDKKIKNRKPLTEYKLTAQGRRAFAAYCQAWRQITGT